MPDFKIALTFLKKSKKISIVELDRNYFDNTIEYMKEADLVSWVYSIDNEDTRREILDKINHLGGQGGNDFGSLVFINQSKCFAGRNILAAIACVEKIRDKILQDTTI
ncbi:MAG TPA: hypothetical protein PKG90_11585 [Chitinophagaceae bacterium]|nr:hypothetical protein [Chitinophagaceae bacterium]HNU13133.1 hypothetical protein [Chitinophagaceae bacterium]